MRFSIRAFRTTELFFWLLAVILYFWNLGGGSLEFWDESLSAERSREFVLTGDWLTPHSGLEPDFNKPPVYYWLTALNFALLGETEFTVRLGSVLFGVGCLIFTRLIGRETSQSEWGGLLSAFFLATNPHWINYTRNGMLDSGLMFGALAGIYFLIYGSPVSGVILSGAAFALGSLIKNPLALMGLLVPVAELGFVRKSGRPWVLRTLISAAIACLLSLSWYGFQCLKWGPAYFDQFVGYNMLTRFSRSIEGHEGGPFFYLETWWGGSGVSMALFILPLAYFLFRERAALRRFAAWLAILLVFLVLLSGSASKRGFYLLLIYPFVAIISGGLWWSILRSMTSRIGRTCLAIFLIVAPAACLGARYKPCIHGSTSLKELALRLRADGGANAVMFSVGIPSEPIMFYSHVLTRAVWEEPSSASLQPLLRETKTNIFFWARQGKKERLLRALDEAGRPSLCYRQNADYCVILALPPPWPSEGEPFSSKP
jgi:4-amino-4-deoxy-L-arabinose transferase-like glycosyltransferase